MTVSDSENAATRHSVDGHATIQFTLLVGVVGIIAMAIGMLIFNSGNESLGAKIVLLSAFSTLIGISAVVWRIFK